MAIGSTNIAINDPPQLTGPGATIANNPAFSPTNLGGGNLGDYSTPNPAGYTTPQNPSAWSTFNQNANQFLKSPLGQVAGAATVGGIAEWQAAQANANARKLAGSISTLGQPYSQAGAQQLGQITPQLATGTAESATAANELGQVAMQYGTGQLTAAQQTQVTAYKQQQRAQVDSQFAASGNLDSSARNAAYQQIDNNAAMLTQQLIQGNVSMAQGALQSVQSTYSSMLNQALAQSGFGLGAQTQAVSLLLQNDQATSAQLNKLFAALAQGLGTSAGGGGKGGGQGAGAATNWLSKLGGGGGNVNQTQAVPGIGQDVGAGTVPGAYTPDNPLGTTPLVDPSTFSYTSTAGQDWSTFSQTGGDTPNFNIDTGDGGAVSTGN